MHIEEGEKEKNRTLRQIHGIKQNLHYDDDYFDSTKRMDCKNTAHGENFC